MAVQANQRVLVRRPGTLAAPYGLFAVTRAAGTLIDQMPEIAGQGGIYYWTGVCDLPNGYEVNCIDLLVDKGVGTVTNLIAGDPFVVLTQLSCGSVGLDQAMLTQLMAERRLAGEQALVEQVFSEGLFGAEPSLANSATPATLLAASANVVAAVALLEETLYSSYGPLGVLHVPYLAAPYLMQAKVIWRDNAGIWRTAAGTPVSIGNYSGLSPAGAAPAANSTYLYITGQVSIWRTPESEIFMPALRDVLNRSTNQINAQSEREYIVTYECSALATLTTLATV